MWAGWRTGRQRPKPWQQGEERVGLLWVDTKVT